MDQILRVIKETKYGKWAVVCLILGLISITAKGPLVFWPIAVILYFIGMKKLNQQSSDPQEATTISDTKDLTSENDSPSNAKFKATKNYEGYIIIDANNRLWKAPKCKRGGTVYKFEDLLNFGLVEDGNTITKGGKGAALAGGIVFGAVGAIVGGVTANRKSSATCSKMQIVLNVNNLKNPTLYIDLIDEEVKKDSKDYQKAYKKAQTILGALEIISA